MRKCKEKQKNSIAVLSKEKRGDHGPWNRNGRESIVANASDPIQTFSLTVPLSLSIEDVALTYFLSSHVCGSHFAYLPKVYSDGQNCVTLATSVRAAAMAAFSRELKGPETMQKARGHYSHALVLINKALANPSLAVLDSTLISVLLLSLFETVAQERRESPTNW